MHLLLEVFLSQKNALTLSDVYLTLSKCCRRYLRSQWFGDSTEQPFLNYARRSFIILFLGPLLRNLLIGETDFKQGLLALQ